MNSVLSDVRYSLRTLRNNPGFTAAAVLTLALGVGATLAVFTVVNAVLLRPLPYADSARLVTVGHHNTRTGEDEAWISWETLRGLRGAVPEVQAAAGVSPEWDFTLRAPEGAERLQGYWVSASFLPMLGVRPELGRNFMPEEDRPGGQPVVLLSHRLWRDRFGGSRDILGRSIQIGSMPVVVIGVLPASFRYGADVDLWAPLGQNPLVSRGRQVRWVQGLAKLKEGATLAGDRESIAT
jgi:putative ABC transport system permease protein